MDNGPLLEVALAQLELVVLDISVIVDFEAHAETENTVMQELYMVINAWIQNVLQEVTALLELE